MKQLVRLLDLKKEFNMWPFIWLIVFFYNCVGAWINKLNNDGKGWFIWACIISACQLFPIISKYSKNLLVDGLIYDVVIFFAYLITLMVLGCGKAVSFIQWTGFI